MGESIRLTIEQLIALEQKATQVKNPLHAVPIAQKVITTQTEAIKLLDARISELERRLADCSGGRLL